MSLSDWWVEFKAKLKSAVCEKAASIIPTLVGILITSGAGHVWGVSELTGTQKVRDYHIHRADSLQNRVWALQKKVDSLELICDESKTYQYKK